MQRTMRAAMQARAQLGPIRENSEASGSGPAPAVKSGSVSAAKLGSFPQNDNPALRL